ncbi:MAG: DUF134 domain-containing protein [Lachnospiraceae bacterium]
MARPIKHRRICEMPQTKEFMPCNGVAKDTVELAIEEYETIRLIDYLGLTQEDCAIQMKVARTTVQSIYEIARKKVADVMVNGKRMLIQGGNYDICINASKCCGKDCNEHTCQEENCQNGESYCRHCSKQ